MNLNRYREIISEITPHGARLVAVSKTRPVADISELYGLGQRLFGENKVQEMTDKQEALPKDIDWHLIGHLQTNKVKYIAPYVGMIHAVDSLRLLEEIDKQAEKSGRIIPCLLQVHIAMEETKFGMDSREIQALLTAAAFKSFRNIEIHGLMGMASNTENREQVDREFAGLKSLFDEMKKLFFADKPYFKELSMGMSSDYKIALKHGATLVRIGSEIFGGRTPH
jgi:pyridoxal phosphate enzyme (YggS family)